MRSAQGRDEEQAACNARLYAKKRGRHLSGRVDLPQYKVPTDVASRSNNGSGCWRGRKGEEGQDGHWGTTATVTVTATATATSSEREESTTAELQERRQVLRSTGSGEMRGTRATALFRKPTAAAASSHQAPPTVNSPRQQQPTQTGLNTSAAPSGSLDDGGIATHGESEAC